MSYVLAKIQKCAEQLPGCSYENKNQSFKKPDVIVIITGDELISSNKNPLVISTNQIMIKKIVDEFGGNLKNIYVVKDKTKDLEKLIKKLGILTSLLPQYFTR